MTSANVTVDTPAIERRRPVYARGRRAPPTTAGATNSKSARTLEMASATPVFRPCRTPKSAKATLTCKRISPARTGLRRMPDQMRGRNFIGIDSPSLPDESTTERVDYRYFDGAKAVLGTWTSDR